MENEEESKKPIPEEIEKFEGNLEQKTDEEIQPVEEDQEVALSDINQKIAEKEQNIEDTQNKIKDITNDIRVELGLPLSNESGEVPPSIKHDQGSIEKLNQEKEKLNSSQEKSEEMKRFESNIKNTLDDIFNKSKIMFDALYERQQNRLTPIQTNDHFQHMVSLVKNLKNFDSKIDIKSVPEITESINKLARSFDEFKVSSTGMIKENKENLDKLAYGAKSFGTTIDESGRKLPLEMEDKQIEEKSKELRKSLQNLSEQSEKLWLFAVKLRENIR